jgi:hypothetical protein
MDEAVVVIPSSKVVQREYPPHAQGRASRMAPNCQRFRNFKRRPVTSRKRDLTAPRHCVRVPGRAFGEVKGQRAKAGNGMIA